jgi:flagellar basal body L-ring protein FlgH
VDISDVNDNNPVFVDVDQSFTIVEGNATVIGTVFGSVRASDIDTDNIITYSIR